MISRKRLREFWEIPNHQDAESLLTAWHKAVEAADWENVADVKAVYRSVDLVGNCLVFDIGNNRYRLIARVMYNKRRVYVLRVMTHKEYDRNTWVEDCGCHQPPSKPKPVFEKPARKKR